MQIAERTPAGARPGDVASRLTFVAAILSSVVLACGGSRPPEDSFAEPITLSVDTPLLPGDALQVTFSREPGLNGSFAIDETGTVSLPLIGDMSTTGRPAGEIKAEVEREYDARTRNQSVQVIYLRRIRVLGEVRSPGIYHADPTQTLDDIVALAGGAETEGNLSKVSLVRGGKVIEQNLDVRRGASVDLQSGDQIFVPRTSWFSRNAAVLIGATISAIALILAFTE